jgi:hypothetical protein
MHECDDVHLAEIAFIHTELPDEDRFDFGHAIRVQARREQVAATQQLEESGDCATP